MVISSVLARSRFPAGLIQPAGSFRFSLDALLLASFALRCAPSATGPLSLLDLGCGCGVVGLACLLERADLTGRGADREADLVAAANENAALLGFAGRYAALHRDLAEAADRTALAAETADMVLANMPYRPAGSGRLPESALRRRALFAEAATMPAFMQTAKAALKPEGVFALIYPWAERESLFTGLTLHGFFAETVLPVCTAGAEKTLCLVAARQRPAGTDILPPLRLREEKGGAYSAEAVSFCRWL